VFVSENLDDPRHRIHLKIEGNHNCKKNLFRRQCCTQEVSNLKTAMVARNAVERTVLYIIFRNN